MGPPKGGGYIKKDVLTPTGNSVLEQLLKLAGNQFQSAGDITQNPAYQQALSATQSFLPNAQGQTPGFAPIQAEAQRNFQQQTIPSILGAFGQGNKGSSALNQALAGAGQNLNSSLGSLLAQMQLQAANQSGNLAQIPYNQGLQSANLGLNTSPFAYLQKANPFWQDLLLSGISGISKVAAAYAPGAG